MRSHSGTSCIISFNLNGWDTTFSLASFGLFSLNSTCNLMKEDTVIVSHIEKKVLEVLKIEPVTSQPHSCDCSLASRLHETRNSHPPYSCQFSIWLNSPRLLCFSQHFFARLDSSWYFSASCSLPLLRRGCLARLSSAKLRLVVNSISLSTWRSCNWKKFKKVWLMVIFFFPTACWQIFHSCGTSVGGVIRNCSIIHEYKSEIFILFKIFKYLPFLFLKYDYVMLFNIINWIILWLSRVVLYFLYVWRGTT